MEQNIVQKEIIQLLATNEAMISQLYKVYSLRIPELRDFWSNLSAEEIEHEKWLLELYKRLEGSLLTFNEHRFNKEDIESFNTYVNDRLDEIRASVNISTLEALSISLDIEKALIEKNFFKIFETDDSEMYDTLRRLEVSTEHHLKEVQKKWDNENLKSVYL